MRADPARCPICGQDNACGMAGDVDARLCWCATEKFPKDLLERVPAESRGRACICGACVKRAQAAAGERDQ